MSQADTPAAAAVFVLLLVDEAAHPCRRVEVSAAVEVVTSSPLRPFSQVVPVTKHLGSESQVAQEALAAAQIHRSHQRPCRSVLADQVPPMSPKLAAGQAALMAPWVPSL